MQTGSCRAVAASSGASVAVHRFDDRVVVIPTPAMFAVGGDRAATEIEVPGVSEALLLNAGGLAPGGAIEQLVGERGMRFGAHRRGIGAIRALLACGACERIGPFWDDLDPETVRPNLRNPWRAPVASAPRVGSLPSTSTTGPDRQPRRSLSPSIS
jgi:hypothetical protein